MQNLALEWWHSDVVPLPSIDVDDPGARCQMRLAQLSNLIAISSAMLAHRSIPQVS